MNHAGALLASSSVLWLLPDQKTGIFVAANRQARDPVLALIAYYLADVTSGETPWLNHTTSCTFPEPWRELQPVVDIPNEAHAPQRPLEEYTGTYGNKLFGDFRVFIRHAPEPRLEIKYGEHFEGFLLPSETKDTFSVTLTGVYWFLTEKSPIPDAVTFKEDTHGALQYLTFIMQQEVIEFSRCVRFNDHSSSVGTNLNSSGFGLCLAALMIFWHLSWSKETYVPIAF